MRVRNKIDRYHLAIDIMNKLKINDKEITNMLEEKLTNHEKYIKENGIDTEEIRNWKYE